MLDHCEQVSSVRLLAPKLDESLPSGSLRLTSAIGRLPTGSLLWSIEDLIIREGEWTLIQGSEGSGKTTLLRLLAGSWPVQEGTELRLGIEGKVVSDPASVTTTASSPDGACDAKEDKLDVQSDNASSCGSYHTREKLLTFVPVGAYRLRAGLRLKKAACYPQDEESFGDDEVVDALESVGLGKLLHESFVESGTLAQVPEDGAGRQAVAVGLPSAEPQKSWPALHSDDGDRMLSAGEAQRLELAHVLLTRPRWCFMDEPVSHVAEEDKPKLFEMLRAKLAGSSTLVTITHDVTALANIHDATLQLSDGELRKIVKAA
jgi:putative ATP-binding cassette transporter